MKIYDLEQENKEIKHEILSKINGDMYARTGDMWL